MGNVIQFPGKVDRLDPRLEEAVAGLDASMMDLLNVLLNMCEEHDDEALITEVFNPIQIGLSWANLLDAVKADPTTTAFHEFIAELLAEHGYDLFSKETGYFVEVDLEDDDDDAE